MAPLSTSQLRAKDKTGASFSVVAARVGIAAAAAVLLFTGLLGVLVGAPSTGTEIPPEVVALVESLYSSEDFVTTELASYYAPREVPARGEEYLNDVWSVISGSRQ